MKFSKTYSSLIYSPEFPEEWRDKAINYRQLKKLINQVAIELSSLGLNPALLQKLLDDEVICDLGSPQDPGNGGVSFIGATYEVSNEGSVLSPRIRLRLAPQANMDHPPETQAESPSLATNLDPNFSRSPILLPPASRRFSSLSNDTEGIPDDNSTSSSKDTTTDQHLILLQSPSIDESGQQEIIVPLNSDSAFYQLLTNALSALATLHQKTLEHSSREIEALADIVSSTSRPVSRTRRSRFSLGKFRHGDSDLYSWRTIFQLWVEMEIFESLSERERGERSLEDVEIRMKKFAEELNKRGLSDDANTFVQDESKVALRRFLKLNILILDLRKFQYANTEAIRKILKKHEKRTALPMTPTALTRALSLQISGTGFTLPHILLVKITETLLPVIPSLDDYCCLICTSIAFKPIKLACGHLFCVRCLSKMQKRGTPDFANCALCRAPTVFQADKNNLDLAMMRFMEDWFPKESRIKAKENEKEVADELAEELGLVITGGSGGTSGDDGCLLM